MALYQKRPDIVEAWTYEEFQQIYLTIEEKPFVSPEGYIHLFSKGEDDFFYKMDGSTLYDLVFFVCRRGSILETLKQYDVLIYNKLYDSYFRMPAKEFRNYYTNKKDYYEEIERFDNQ